MLNKNSSNLVNLKDLKVEVTNSDGSKTTLETPEIKTTDSNGATITISDSNKENIKTEDYIYVGEWGIKIKIPSSLKNVAYIYDNYGNLCVNGVKYLEGGIHYAPAFSMIEENWLACVSRGTGENYNPDDGWWRDPSQATTSLDGYYYWVQSSQFVYSIDDSEMEWESQSRGLVMEMLSTPENYSKI